MKNKYVLGIIFLPILMLCFAFISFCQNGVMLNGSELDLTKTVWKSQYFHFRNTYHFQTDSSGYAARGEPHLYKNTMMYQNVQFLYELDTVQLIIKYIDGASEEPYVYNVINDERGVFFLSTFEYTYGKESIIREAK